MPKVITFNKTGYDPFIDFLKAYAIVFVVVAHSFPAALWKYCLFQVWGDMQVPMFILIQVFHAYKKGYKPSINWQSMTKRIIIPFVIIQCLILLFRLVFSGQTSSDVLLSTLKAGGFGRGSYYFWIYLQMAFILVWIWPLIMKLTRKQLTLVFLLFSIGCEILFSVVNFPDSVYRLLAVRYLFLIPLAMIWVNEGVVLNFKRVFLSILSVSAVIFFCYTKYDLEPFFYNTAWSFHRWICYFYLPILLTWLLWKLYIYIYIYMKNNEKMMIVCKNIAKCSYEIYLVQMMVFIMLPGCVSFIHIDMVRIPLWMLLSLSFSIIGGIVLNKILQRIYKVKK